MILKPTNLLRRVKYIALSASLPSGLKPRFLNPKYQCYSPDTNRPIVAVTKLGENELTKVVNRTMHIHCQLTSASCSVTENQLPFVIGSHIISCTRLQNCTIGASLLRAAMTTKTNFRCVYCIQWLYRIYIIVFCVCCDI